MKLTDIPDIHTHNVASSPGTAIVNLPMDILENPPMFHPQTGAYYSTGIHPLYEGNWAKVMDSLALIVRHPQIIAIGECGLDKRSSVELSIQMLYLEKQMELADSLQKPLIIHCVHCWNELIQLHQKHPSEQPRIIHGFRGKPQLVQQLLHQGFHLSFGKNFNTESLRLCPASKRYSETDDEQNISITDVYSLHTTALHT